MKILFAVSNDNITTSVVNKYQQKYKEIITNKNVYYFNAIIKELQKNKNYDAIVIGEDLEPISNNNYEAIDKFLFEKLDAISDEASKPTGEDIPVILICSDRRTQADGLLIKLFGIGIYNAIIGNDRSIDTVCNLINKPRNKKEAKIYYNVESDDITPYEHASESDVSETEIQNILAHYRKIGTNPKKCVESFSSIAEQYNDTQLRIIIKFLPKEIKAILETNSARYQKLVNNGTVLSNGKYITYNSKRDDENNGKRDILTKDLKKTNLSRPVIIPSTININKKNEMNNPNVNSNPNINQNINKNINQGVKQMNSINPNINQNLNQNNMNRQLQGNIPMQNTQNNMQGLNNMDQMKIEDNQIKPIENNIVNPIAQMPQMIDLPTNESMTQPIEETPVKRGRGRPRKNPESVVPKAVVQYDEFGNPIKRGRGRPRKQPVENQLNNNLVAYNNDTMPIGEPVNANNDVVQSNDIFGDNSLQDAMPGLEPIQDNDIFGMDLSSNTVPGLEENNDIFSNNEVSAQNDESIMPGFGLDNDLENLFSLDATSEPVLSKEDNNIMPGFENNESSVSNQFNNDLFTSPYRNEPKAQDFGGDIFNTQSESLINTKNVSTNSNSNNIIAGNGKLVSFVGTSKNGTSFIVNNLAQMLSNSNVKTAILDLTQNRNSYYMFTNNDQNLMQIAVNSIKGLSEGRVNGVNVNRNLSVFTALPDEKIDVNINNVMQTLSNNFDVILIDCDFDTEVECFKNSNETYLIQTMDTFTIQPLTKFLSDLKLKNSLNESKLRVVINKYIRLRKLNEKMIIGGMSKYNEPSMTLQRDLFNSQTIKYVTIPFETDTYAKYLENIAMCELNLSGYSQNLMNALEELKNMVYPLIYGGNKPNSYVKQGNTEEKRGLFGGRKQTVEPQGAQFTSNINDTLNKMRSNNF